MKEEFVIGKENLGYYTVSVQSILVIPLSQVVGFGIQALVAQSFFR